jgi:type IV pilus assembly protein PilQ
MKIKNRNVIAAAGFVLSLSIMLVSSVTSYAAIKETEITGIEVLDNAIQIKADAPITYKLYRPEDPFRVTVDIEGARLGKFVDKMFPDRAGVTEIEPVQILNPATVARFNILLQSPATITPEVRDTVLVLAMNGDGKPASADAEESKMTDDGLAASDADDGTDTSETDPAAAEEIVQLLFNKTAGGAELVLKGDGAMPEPEVFKFEDRVIIDIPDISTSAPLPPDIAAPVKHISYKEEKDKLRVTIDFEAGAKASVAALDDELVVDIASKGISGGKGEPAMKTACQGEVKKQPVSFDVQDADLAAIIGILNYDMTGCNIVINPDDVKGKKITMKLLNVPWDQALDIILKTFGLEKISEGNVIRVVTKNTLQEEQKADAATKELIGIETKVFLVNYANVDKIKDSIDKAKILTSRGNLSTDPRTRSIIVKDIPSSLEEVQKLIVTLDKPTPQVLIEARMVEVSKNFDYELGVEWGGYWTPTATKSAFNLVGSTSSGATGINGSQAVTTVPSGTSGTTTPYFPTLVNVPTSGAPTGAFTLGYLNAARTLGLDLRISALESSGRGRIISNPKVMTVDNEQAVIKQGQKIPYSTVSNAGTQVQFIDAALSLTVVPHVGPDKSILLNIQVSKDSADFSQVSQGLPTITTNEATTQVLIKDGETVVMGGILTSTEQENENAVPGISKIPLLGALFKHNLKTITSDELLIFITPRVIE